MSLDKKGREPSSRSRGALVISLDFELHWGIRDIPGARSTFKERVLGARRAIPRLLDLFEDFGIAATWATVGFLFASNREELELFAPKVRPRYKRRELSPYDEPIGNDEDDDPLHFAPSLIEAIRQRSRQEIGTHTFSHYYCLEPGQSRESFAADLASATAIAAHRGVELRSIVLPRNQFNEAYEDLLVDAGLSCYRGNQAGWMYQPQRGGASAIRRAARLLDSHFPVSRRRQPGWGEFIRPSGLCNIPATIFLRPWTLATRRTASLRLRRIMHGIGHASSEGGVFHLWWHPHNFGMHTNENLAFLRRILERFRRCRDVEGMRSMTMAEVADFARSRHLDA
jgi:peptidoglycan/xylan/chitin deacetylase (PgdA/CDA1 family)